MRCGDLLPTGCCCVLCCVVYVGRLGGSDVSGAKCTYGLVHSVCSKKGDVLGGGKTTRSDRSLYEVTRG